jgi:hypothetical protein
LGHRVGQSAGDGLAPVLPSVNPTAQVDYVLDLTRQYHNLLQSDNATYMWDFGVLFGDDESYQLDELGSPLRRGMKRLPMMSLEY